MKARREGSVFALVTLAWTLVWCVDLAQAWRDSPYDRFGWLAAAGWVAWVWLAGRRAKCVPGLWLAAAWGVSFVGVAGELNVLQHAGLALAGAAWAGGGRRGMIALVLALGWVPALGWALKGAGAEVVPGLRLTTALVAAGLAWRERRAA